MACDVTNPVRHLHQTVDNLRTPGLLPILGAVESGHVVRPQKVLARLPVSAVTPLVPVHAVRKGESVVKRDRRVGIRHEEAALVDVFTFLLANGFDFVHDFAGKQKLATHQRGKGHATCVEQVTNQVPQPLEQVALGNVGLAHLAVEPQDEPLRGPAFDVGIQNQLLCFTGELVGDVPAVQVDFKAARRLTDGELVRPHLGRIIEQRPVVVFHQQVRIGKLQRALDFRHEARNLEGLPLFGG